MLSSGPSVPLSIDLVCTRLGPASLLLESNRLFRCSNLLSLGLRLLAGSSLLLSTTPVLGLTLLLRSIRRGALLGVVAVALDLLLAPPRLDFGAQSVRLGLGGRLVRDELRLLFALSRLGALLAGFEFRVRLSILKTPLARERLIAGDRTRSGLQPACDLAGKAADGAFTAAHLAPARSGSETRDRLAGLERGGADELAGIA
jgi:hypothetical protein